MSLRNSAEKNFPEQSTDPYSIHMRIFYGNAQFRVSDSSVWVCDSMFNIVK